MLFRTAVIVWACSTLTLAGCVGRETVTVKTLDARSWLDRSQDELVESWGEPDGEQRDDRGRRVLVYRGSKRDTIYVPVPEHKIPDQSRPEGFIDIGVGPSPRTYYASGAIARFHVDDEGVIREYWIDPTLRRMPLPLE